MGPVTLKRGLVVELLILAVFIALLLRVLLLQTVDFEKYQSKVIDQLTVESSVKADRLPCLYRPAQYSDRTGREIRRRGHATGSADRGGPFGDP